MAVKFLMQHTVGTLYVKGEVAGFDKRTEADLIERKIAKAVKSHERAGNADASTDDDADANDEGGSDGAGPADSSDDKA